MTVMYVLLIASAAPAVGAPSVQIEILVFAGGEGLQFFVECAREYEKQHPGITVNLYGGPRIKNKVRVRLLEGTPPEITNTGTNQWALIRSGNILRLDEFLDGPNWEGDRTWRESFIPGSLDRYTDQGKTYAVPFMYNISLVWYNKKMFREHGWQSPKTWDEFFQLCEKIKAAGIWPLAFQGRYPGYAQALINSAYYHLAGPQRLFDQLNLVPGSFANPQFERALYLVKKTATEYFQKGAMGMGHTEAQLEFFLGHTAMICCGTWLKSEMMGKIPKDFELGAFNLPIVPAGKADPTSVYAGPGYYFVFKNCKHPREAVDFLRFMTSRRMAGRFVRQRDIPVAVRDVNKKNLSKDMSEVAAIIEAARASYGSGPGERFPEMEQYWSNIRFKLLTGRIEPKDAAAELEKAAGVVREKTANPDHITIRHIVKPLILLGLLLGAIILWLVTTITRMRSARRSRTRRTSAGCLRLGWLNILIFVGPVFVLYTVFVIIPCMESFSWSLQRWDGLTDKVYVGLLHFKRILFESDGFWTALRNNLFIMFMVPLFVLPLSLFFAACISRGVRGSRLFRILFFFPNVLGVVATTLLWMHMYNPQGGVVNSALTGIGRAFSAVGINDLGNFFQGFAGFTWLSQDNLYWALIPMSIWGACGFNMILFLAAMESVPQSLYEAADIDGASTWRQFWTITLPLIWEVLSIAVVFMVIGGMKAFEVIWLLTNQSPTTETHVIGTRMVQSMFTEFKIGEATAIAVLLFLMVFFGTAATLRVMRRETVEF